MGTNDVQRPRIGRPAPEIDMIDTAGRRWRSSERGGKTIVAIFHRHIH